jgi:hypothetical protein
MNEHAAAAGTATARIKTALQSTLVISPPIVPAQSLKTNRQRPGRRMLRGAA